MAIVLAIAIAVAAVFAHAQPAPPALSPLGVAQPAPPPPPREIDLTTVLLDEVGKPVKDQTQVSKEDPNCDKCAVMTLGLAISHALMATYDDDRGQTWEQRFALASLGMKARESQTMQLSATEIAVILKRVGKGYGPLLIYRVLPLLDPTAAAHPQSIQ